MQDIMITDLSVAQPSEALADFPMCHKWYKLPYETEEYRGVLLRSFPDDPAPRVRIDFEASGSYAVYLGIHYAEIDRDDLAIRFGACNEFARLRIRLSGDPEFTLVLPEEQNVKSDPDPEREIQQHAITEVFWRYADFDGPTFVEIEPGPMMFEPCPGNPACLAWVRLEPLNDRQKQLATALKPRPDTRCNSYSLTYADPAGPQEIGELDAWLATSDVDRLQLDLCRFSVCRFPTRVGIVSGDTPCEVGNFEFRHSKDLKRHIDAGMDPLLEMVNIAARHGVEVYLSMRMVLQRNPPQHLGHAWPNPMLENRHWWVQDVRGDSYPHPALAVEEVRQQVVDVFREVVERYNVAGVCIYGMRGWPWVGYEPASAKLFEQHYGTPITDVPETDPRFVDHRCRVVGSLMKEIRQALDEVGQSRNCRFKLALDAMNCIENCRGQGLDIIEWANSGLIDVLTLNACHWEGRPVDHENTEPQFTRQIRQAIKDPKFSLRAGIWPRFMNPQKYLIKARAMLDAGAEGLAFWDLGHRTSRLSEWAIQRHLGHVELYDHLQETCRSYWRSVPLKQMDGVAMTNPDYSASSAG